VLYVKQSSNGQLLEELSTLVDNPGRGGKEPLISEYYKELTLSVI
jgi:hypothetical protein